ncbi:hypothetical protein AY605_11705 [Acinetobacter sp. SFD]|uniref:MetQ/NlpA family ABC transporter substrate-binding protein n=1 Tax=unclassified Acinetobacter TaxID=196816 RepID=UPI0007D09D33|nr:MULTISPECIES: MetQ/NlpA family ABC transporter substrate-binding protein [unclassified Acinetobacter]ATO21107.1 hypothetical protein BS636_15495 [Acinetobacter sp. LoGeW2-3]OAL83290.1 hypothetical protein AY605_11705 [Acinetobacter sp. SFD]
MKFKNVLTAALAASIGFGLSGCAKQDKTATTANSEIKVVTLLTRDNPPYPQVAEYVKNKVKEQNIELKIKYANDGLIPNKSVADDEADLNYFQHKYYMQSAKELNNWDLVAIASTFNGMFGAYSPKYKNINELPDKAKVIIPSDPSNGGRALNLLARAKLIELKSNTGAKTSLKDITANPKKLRFLEVEHALVPVSFNDSDLAIMAGAYTIHADLIPKRDSIYLEQDNQEYDSVLVSNSKAAQRPEVELVKEAFIAEDTREFVLKNYADTVTWPKR